MRRRGRLGRGRCLAAGGCCSPLASRSARAPAHCPVQDDGFLAALGELREASFPDKEAIVERLRQSGHPSARPVLAALLEDRLYVRSQDQKIFIVKSADDSLASLELVDPLSLKDAGSGAARRPDQDRHEQPPAKAAEDDGRALRSVEPRRRRCGWPPSKEMLRSLDEASIALLRQRVRVETDAGVKAEIETGLALAALDGGDPPRRAWTRSPRSLTGSGPKCATGWPALLEKSAGRQLRRERR